MFLLILKNLRIYYRLTHRLTTLALLCLSRHSPILARSRNSSLPMNYSYCFRLHTLTTHAHSCCSTVVSVADDPSHPLPLHTHRERQTHARRKTIVRAFSATSPDRSYPLRRVYLKTICLFYCTGRRLSLSRTQNPCATRFKHRGRSGLFIVLPCSSSSSYETGIVAR